MRSNSKHFILTILVLTHNRPDRCNDLIKSIEYFVGSLDDRVELFVIDDSNHNYRGRVTAQPQTRVLSHIENLGFKESLIEGIQLAKGKFVLYLADDDRVDHFEIVKLVNLCELSNFSLCSTTFYFRSGQARSFGDQKLCPRDFFEASFHAPGLLFNSDVCRRLLKGEQAKSLFSLYFAQIFPQVVILLLLLSEGLECVWSTISPVREVNPDSSNLRDSRGRVYKDPISRILQMDSLINIVDRLFPLSTDTAIQIKYYCERKCFSEIRRSFSAAFPHVQLPLSNNLIFYLRVFAKYPLEGFRASYSARLRRKRFRK